MPIAKCNSMLTKTTSKIINRYVWLLNTLLQYNRLTFEEISLLWDDSDLSDDKELALRTFHDHRKAIKELFGVEIKCDPSNHKYYLSSRDFVRKNLTVKGAVNAFTVANMVHAKHYLPNRILFEETPRGTEYIQPIVDAMRQNKVLSIDYSPYGKNRHRRDFHFHPYAMKVYHQRWYLVGMHVEESAIRNISLDRILELEVLDETFVYSEDFDAKKYYQNTVGIFVNEELPPQKVRIRVFGSSVDYLRTLPLHKSQAEVLTKYGEYSEFEYNVSLTPELSSHLLAMGDNVEILEPTELRNEIETRLKTALERYNKC